MGREEAPEADPKDGGSHLEDARNSAVGQMNWMGEDIFEPVLRLWRVEKYWSTVYTFLAELVFLVAVADCKVTELFEFVSVAEFVELEAVEHTRQRQQREAALLGVVVAGRPGSFGVFAFEAEAQVPLEVGEEGPA